VLPGEVLNAALGWWWPTPLWGTGWFYAARDAREIFRAGLITCLPKCWL
jgi:hypothetical protein